MFLTLLYSVRAKLLCNLGLTEYNRVKVNHVLQGVNLSETGSHKIIPLLNL